MIEFVKSRRYIFRTDLGLHVGTFIGIKSGKLEFANATHIVETSDVSSVMLDPLKMVDAEEWNHHIAISAGVSITELREAADDVKLRRPTVVHHVTSAEMRNW